MFNNISKTPDQGTTSECEHSQYLHDRPSAGINYYRIKQVDFDEQYSYSNVVELHVDHDSRVKNIMMAPNPVVRGQAFRFFGLNSGEEIKMYNLQGQEVQIQKVSDRQENIINVPSGIYYINDNQHGRFSKIVVVELLGNQFITIKSSVKPT